MHYLLKLFPEITIKSRSVRRHMTRCLAGNVRTILRRLDEGVSVKDTWDALHVTLPEALPEALTREMEERLTRIPGIHEVLAIREAPFSDLTDIADQVVPLWQHTIAGRRFRVSAKRRGDHDFSSEHIERLIGRRLLEASPDARVDLTRADVNVSVEVVHQRLRLIQARWPGLGGYPLGLQGQALTLISGGFDSPVAAWRMMRRGIKTHFLFFNLGGPAHEAGVREVTHHLWQRYGSSHRVNFLSVPFEGVVAEILRSVPDGLMGVVLKRMMVRAASRIAHRERIPALVTGDAIAQVSSQTLTNLALIDEASELPILRPLLTEDKQDIIAQARRLDTARFAETMPEYCGVISRRPHTRARAHDVEQAEAGFDFAVLEAAIRAVETTRSDRLMERRHPPGEVPTVDSPQALAQLGDASVIDIRAPEEREASPLRLPDVPRLEIPFYELQGRAPDLPDDRCYLLYCDQGVMSRMQALHLHDRGLTHFGVYRTT
ncbi:tRNA uracil 4-sulfurtransferase ThiI [Halomonas heilongjiangensis]|uniref:Probable tRNA sulfurtransferase n=1 Tax=Halomonas heilongjiangensis TaxID=1387883 RepID=A0A2N7TTX3_9GAMM|nr:tRNA uracil 4-sulfurtransferase ThiI [Halomonas heilongjiangensis]PMR71598.1 tRNA 4-thiouridine(8) synthase ThiI [Halomonas heilongjiangensis]PXX94309.1 tRNA 4-thiouridine(8) synthase ThiI [Halomonas heilongjiangensis]